MFRGLLLGDWRDVTEVSRCARRLLDEHERADDGEHDEELEGGSRHEALQRGMVVHVVRCFQTDVQQRDPHAEEGGVLDVVHGVARPAHEVVCHSREVVSHQ